MLSTSLLSFSHKLPPLASDEVIDDDDEDDPLSLSYRQPSDRPGSLPSTLSDLGLTVNSVKVKYLGSVRASGSTAILKKGITAIQPELIDLYTAAQRKFVGSLANGSSDLSYQIIEICNYGVVIAEPDPAVRTTLSILGETKVGSGGRLVVTKVITPLSNIVLWAAIRFTARTVKIKGRTCLGAAFIPLSCSSAVFKRSQFTRLSGSRAKFLATLGHPPLFLCVLRKVDCPKTFECHLSACLTIEDAMSLSSNLSDIHAGISRVGRPSLPIPGDVGSYSYTSFGETGSDRTSSRLNGISLLSESEDERASRLTGRHLLRSDSPSILTERYSRLTVDGASSRLAPNRYHRPLPRSEMINYRREIGLRPWPSSVGPSSPTRIIKNGDLTRHLNGSITPVNSRRNDSPIYSQLQIVKNKKNHPSSSSEHSKVKERSPKDHPSNGLLRTIKSDDASKSEYSVCQRSVACQTCLTSNKSPNQNGLNGFNGAANNRLKSQNRKNGASTLLDHNMNCTSMCDLYSVSRSPITRSKSSNGLAASGDVETNNYNGYVVHFSYNEPSNDIDHRSNNQTQSKSIHRSSGHRFEPTLIVPSSEDESLSKFGRRGQRLFLNRTGIGHSSRGGRRNPNGLTMNGHASNGLITLPPTSQFNNKTALNGFKGLKDQNRDLLRTYIVDKTDQGSDLTYEGDGLLNLNKNCVIPMMTQPNGLNRSSNSHRPLVSSSTNGNFFVHQPEASVRSRSTSLIRRLGRWKIRSWVRQSFNLKFRRKKKRPKTDLFADRELRYLSLAEPLDYVGNRKLGYPDGELPVNRFKVTSNGTDPPKGYFLGMERPSDLTDSSIQGTQEIPEERTGLENLKHLLEQRKGQSTREIESLSVDIKKSNASPNRETKSSTKRENGQQSLSQIDLLGELGYFP